jgi:hypothetical protein
MRRGRSHDGFLSRILASRHCKLHRYVVFELKLGRFEPEYVCKLNFYVQLVDDHLRDRALMTRPWACSPLYEACQRR